MHISLLYMQLFHKYATESLHEINVVICYKMNKFGLRVIIVYFVMNTYLSMPHFICALHFVTMLFTHVITEFYITTQISLFCD
jgi:hypothetical protein